MDKTDNVRWDLMGVSPSGPLDAARLRVPAEIELDDEMLYWRENVDYEEVQAGPSILTDFLSLHRKEPEATLAYARKWGMLGLCEHGTPYMHPGSNLGFGCRFVVAGPSNRYQEPVWTWHRWSEAADAIVTLAGRIANGDPMDDEQLWGRLFHPPKLPIRWEDVHPPFVRGPRKKYSRSDRLIAARTLISRELDLWLEYGSARPVVIADEFGMNLRIGSSQSPNLFAILALRLADVACGGRGLVKCKTCPDWFQPTRRDAKYCRTCQSDGRRERYLKQVQRARTKECQ